MIMVDLIVGEKCKGHLLQMSLGSPLSYNSPSEHNLGYCCACVCVCVLETERGREPLSQQHARKKIKICQEDILVSSDVTIATGMFLHQTGFLFEEIEVTRRGRENGSGGCLV